MSEVLLTTPAVNVCAPLTLPRVARIGFDVLRRDAHIDRIRKAWNVGRVDIFAERDCAEFSFPPGWRIAAPLAGSACSRLVDPNSNERALVTPRPALGEPSILVLLPRYFTVLEHNEQDQVRVAAIDRVGMRPIRVTAWHEPADHATLTEKLGEYEDWLDSVKPGRTNPFMYW